MKKKKPKLLKFVDNKGNTIEIADNVTIEQLSMLGIKEIRLMPKNDPLPDNWYGHTPK